MGRYSLFFLLYLFLAYTPRIYAQTLDTNATKQPRFTQSEPVEIEDRSGMSQEEIRQKAQALDEKKAPLKIKDVVDSIDENGSVNVTNLVKKRWEDLAPTPKNGFDWIRTRYGDWLQGHIRSLYNDELEFDSKEFGIYTFKLKDIDRMLSYGSMRVNIDNAAIFRGVIRYKDGKISIIGGENTYTFDKKLIISIASDNENERDNWVGDIALSIDVRRGNNVQGDFSLKANIQRRTPKNRFDINYLGRYSTKNKEKTADDNRLNVKYDRFVTKKFFITPLFAEYYQNYFQNIQAQITVGLGVGYSIFYTPSIKWDITAGPAFLSTYYYEAVDGGITDKTASYETSSRFEYKINRLNKMKVDYKLSLTDKQSGTYRHHFVVKFENDLIKDRIFIDTSFIWDYIAQPQKTQEFTPKNDDFEFLVGAGVRF